jgi:hypothetical protein
MSLTYESNGTDPIARIINCDDQSELFVYIDENEGPELDEVKEEYLDMELDQDMIDMILESFQKGMTIRGLIDLFSSEESLPQIGMKSIETGPNEQVSILPASSSERVFIAGPSGCGKSTIASQYAIEYKKLYPDSMIHLFARQEDDPAFDGIELEEILVDESILERTITLDDLENSLVIFDDMDNLQDKKLLTYIHKLVNDVMSNGRKKNIYIIYISHLLMNYGQTRVVLNEANKVVFYNGVGSRQNKNFLKTYAGMEKNEVDFLTDLASRWVCLVRKFPRYVIHEKGIFLL